MLDPLQKFCGVSTKKYFFLIGESKYTDNFSPQTCENLNN
jgi:hypothetical protein